MAKRLPQAELVPLSEVEVEEADQTERRAEAWYLSMTGNTQTAIAKRMGVTRQTIGTWLETEAKRRRGRVANIDAEAERLIGQMEAAVVESWRALQRVQSDESNKNAMVGPQYLRLVLDGAKEIARLRGIDSGTSTRGASKTTEVVVRIGGTDLAVGVRS